MPIITRYESLTLLSFTYMNDPYIPMNVIQHLNMVFHGFLDSITCSFMVIKQRCHNIVKAT